MGFARFYQVFTDFREKNSDSNSMTKNSNNNNNITSNSNNQNNTTTTTTTTTESSPSPNGSRNRDAGHADWCRPLTCGSVERRRRTGDAAVLRASPFSCEPFSFPSRFSLFLRQLRFPFACRSFNPPRPLSGVFFFALWELPSGYFCVTGFFSTWFFSIEEQPKPSGPISITNTTQLNEV